MAAPYGDALADSDDGDASFMQDLRLRQTLKEGKKIVATSKCGKQNKSGVAQTGGGSFQQMGLPPMLLKALLQRGFTTPTPIQRIALPAALATPPRDIVGMARTGSGKTLAYMVPLIARLGGQHSVKFGARALVLVPTRELALQVLKVGKDLARGSSKGGDGDSEALRWGMIVGGDGMDEQFAMMAANPDVIIATPGRLLHLLVEMSADLRSVQYVVFDEADRLFELGFSTALNEILSKLSPTRQTLLFSATLPKSLVEFAKAGLQNPKLVRLDSESKISNDLQMAFLSVKPKEKEAALLILLREIIKVPLQEPEGEGAVIPKKHDKKRKREDKKTNQEIAHTQTIIFTATKHHVEYMSLLLANAGYAVSAIYGSLDQSARRTQLATFRAGRTQLLVVTDLAARGIDIPILSNVVNYDFPVGSRTFVHRVGRTARAGRQGWAYSFVTNAELAHLYDLQLFLARPLIVAPDPSQSYSESLVLGTLPRELLDMETEHYRSALLDSSPTLISLLAVAEKGQRMYEKSQAKASKESYRRAKELVQSTQRLAGSERESQSIHPVFEEFASLASNMASTSNSNGKTTADLLAAVNSFRPQETVFEIGSKGKNVANQIMQKRRISLGKILKGKLPATPIEAEESADGEELFEAALPTPAEDVDEVELSNVFDLPPSKTKKAKKTPADYRDESVYLGYTQDGAEAEKGYSINNDGFASQAASAAFDLTATDENTAHSAVQKASMLRWDRRHKKFVKGDGTGADNQKLIKTESGGKLPASFKSGTFDDWKKKEKLYMPRVGDAELKNRQLPQGKKFRFQGSGKTSFKPGKEGKGGVYKDDKKKKSSAQAKSQPKSTLKSVAQIRKERVAKEKRVKRSNQPRRK